MSQYLSLLFQSSLNLLLRLWMPVLLLSYYKLIFTDDCVIHVSVRYASEIHHSL
uniref:Uncharacterized protein n=1 Tax=Rhizophora mucronata TaxID=61149 RepID=A0A2P2PSJ0_RHIMU